MDSSTKRLVDTGLNAVSMVAFAVPGWAPVGVAVLVLTTLFEVFAPADPVKDPGVSNSELKAAVDKVKDVLELADWEAQADSMTYEVLALNQGFHDVLDAVRKVKLDKQRLVLSKTNETVKHFIETMDDYFSMDNAQQADGILTKLDGHRYFLELGDGVVKGLTPQQIRAHQRDHQIASIGIYSCIGSLTVAYLQTAVLWNWGRQLLLAYQYESFLSEFEDWKETQDGMDPRLSGKYSSTITNPSYHPPTWGDWRDGVTNPQFARAAKSLDPNCCANILIQKVKEMVDYCVGTTGAPGFYTTLQNQFNEIDDKVSAAEATVPSGGGAPTLPTIAEMHKAAGLGADAAGYLETLTRKYELSGVNGGDIAALGRALDVWRSVQAGVMFRTHKVTGPPLNTLAKLVQDPKDGYPGGDPMQIAAKLDEFNPGLEFDDKTSRPGRIDWTLKKRSVVKLYDLAALPFLAPPLHQGGGA